MERAEDLIGRTLGRYKITALVGKGGMAAVYKATHPGLGQTVAIKVLHPQMAGDADMLGRFQQEAHAVANLRHPNIVRVVDFDVVADQYFMVMEFIDGPTLAGHLGGVAGRGRRLPGDEVLRIVEPLCSAVDYAHTQGMIHRDIKPANVLLTPQGEPVLTDYGIAKMVGVTQHTATGTVMGSAYYMSPEQAQGTGIDGRTDIYSLGVMLFEMLTGRVPYEGDTLATVLVKHITAPVPAVCSVNVELPPLLDSVMDVALAKDPTQRFQTAHALGVALRQGLTSPAGTALPADKTRLERPPAGAGAPAFTRAETSAAEPLAARTAARDVFISYAASDKETADAVCARLEAERLSCWIAPRDVMPGRSFAQALASAVHAARVFVLVFSSATNASHQVERELDMAVSAGLPIIPLRVEDVRPRESVEYYLAGQHWLDAYTPPLERHLERLTEAVSVLLSQLPAAAAVHEPTTYEPPSGASIVAPVAAAATTLEPEPIVPEPEVATPEIAVAAAATTLEPAVAEVEPAAAEAEAAPPAAAEETAPPEEEFGTLPPIAAAGVAAAGVAAAATTLEPPVVEAEAQPVVLEPEPEPIAPEPEAVVVEAAAAGEAPPETVAAVVELEPEPVLEAQPEPESAEPELAQLEPAYAEPEPAYAEPEPALAEPIAVTEAAEAEAAQVAVAEEPTVEEAEPAAPEAELAPEVAAAAAVAGVTAAATTFEPAAPEPAPAAATTYETPETPAAAPTTYEAPAAYEPTTYETPAAGPTTYEAPAAYEPTTYEAPAVPAYDTAASAGMAAVGVAPVVAPGPAVVPTPEPRASAAEFPRAAFHRRALVLAAGVGVGWVVILFVLDRFVL